MVKQDKELIEKLISLHSITTSGVMEMEKIMRKYIDKSCSVCAHCPGQIKFAHKRLTNWWLAQQQSKTPYSFIKKLE